jgi:4-diphosphocytidyl-2-C-methyl-D-erythritol kinase
VRVPAKVNLCLRVGARRPDGYHAVTTVLHTVALFDVVAVRGDVRQRLTVSGFAVPAGPENLAWKAASAMAEAAGRPPHVHIRLEKRIPPGAGLGGGSADAAGVLLGLRRLWALPWEDATLEGLAARLGSDVPFFIRGGRARATGRGEVLEPLPPLAPDPVVLVKPPFGVSTRQAYAWFDEVGPGGGENDLERAVFSHHPELADAKARLLEAGALRALMSGSGSAVYGVMPSRERAEGVARAFRARGWWAVATRFWP